VRTDDLLNLWQPGQYFIVVKKIFAIEMWSQHYRQQNHKVTYIQVVNVHCKVIVNYFNMKNHMQYKTP